MRLVGHNPVITGTRRVLLKRIKMLDYYAYEYDPTEVASRLKRHGYRGAICGPSGCGKSVLLQALGDALMDHGLTPLPLQLEADRHQALPSDWRRTIRKARHTDALLLDGYDLLPMWARAWVWFASRRAGAVVVTAQRAVRCKTLAYPKPTASLLEQLAQRLQAGTEQSIDYAAVLDQCEGNLRRALERLCDTSADVDLDSNSGKKQAG